LTGVDLLHAGDRLVGQQPVEMIAVRDLPAGQAADRPAGDIDV
jgi:hypothetical protein